MREVFLTLLGPAALAYAAIAATRFWRWLVVLREWSTTEATITAVNAGPTSLGVAPRKRVSYRFRAQTLEYSGQTSFSSGALCEPGNRITIKYDPENPARSALPEPFPAFIISQGQTALIMFVAIVLLAPLLARVSGLGG